MRTLAFCVFVSVCIVGTAQDAPKPLTAETSRPEVLESYIVQLSEYKINGPTDPSQTAADIVASLMKADAKTKPELIETVRLSTLSGSESMVQFGKQVRVTSGTVSVRGTTARQMQNVQFGTIVRVTATPRAGKVVVKLSFESSRLDGKGAENSPPDISTTQIESTQLLEIGKPTLIGGTTADTSSFILLTVTR